MRVIRVELGVQVGLEDVGVVARDTDKAKVVKAEVVLLGPEVEVEGVNYD